MDVLFACVSVQFMHTVPAEARRGCWILWTDGCKPLCEFGE